MNIYVCICTYTPVLKSRLIASVGLQEWASKRPRVANDGTRKMTRDIVIDIGFSEKELRHSNNICATGFGRETQSSMALPYLPKRNKKHTTLIPDTTTNGRNRNA